jgi:hypothetical protein
MEEKPASRRPEFMSTLKIPCKVKEEQCKAAIAEYY